MSQNDVQDFPENPLVEGGNGRTEDEKAADNKLAERLSALIDDANSRVGPLCKMIRKVCLFQGKAFTEIEFLGL
jgi:hypothetical protein